MTMRHAPAITHTLRRVFFAVFGAWLLFGLPVQAQQAEPSVLDALQSGQIEVNVSGRSPSFNQPMLALQATNRTTDPLRLALPPGSILRSVDLKYCDVVVLVAEPPMALAAGQGQTALSGVYGYCLQPAPGERSYPSPEANFRITEEIADEPIKRVLTAIPNSDEAHRDLAPQIAIWMVQGITTLEELQARSGYADLSTYWADARRYAGLQPATAPPAASHTPALISPTRPAAGTATSTTAPTSTGSPWLLALCGAGVLAVLVPLAVFLILPELRGLRKKPAQSTTDPLSSQQIPTDPSLGGRQDSSLGPRPSISSSPPFSSQTSTQPLKRRDGGQQTASNESPAAGQIQPTSPLPRLSPRLAQRKALRQVRQSKSKEAFVQLVVTGGQFDGQLLQAPAGGGLISRNPPEFVLVPDSQVSSPHTAIRLSSGGQKFAIKDLGAQGGTLINGRPLPSDPGTSPELSDGDEIQVGNITLVYQATGPALITKGGSRRYMLGRQRLWLVSREEVPLTPMTEDLLKKATSISSPHAQLDIQGCIRVRDLNSLNGTVVQGQGLQPGAWAVVRDGWTIQIGDVSFKVRTSVAGMPDLIANRYQVRSWMGSGGMADVFVVFDTDDGVERALKVICARHLGQHEQQRQLYLAAFTSEKGRSQAITHRNFVQVRGVGDDAAVGPYLVMDLINGPSVEQLIIQWGRLRPQDAVEIAIQAGDALQHLHRASHLIHCDVAPKNLLVDQNGVVYVTDLGIAMGEGERDPDFFSDGYMAPELLCGEPATPAADVFSLGITLCEMITGQRYQMDATGAGQSSAPPPGSMPESGARKMLLIQHQASDPLADIILRALQEDPGQRYGQMQDFVAALAPYGKGADVQKLVGWWAGLPPAPPAPILPTSMPAAANTSPPAAGSGSSHGPTSAVTPPSAQALGPVQATSAPPGGPNAPLGRAPAPAGAPCPSCGAINRLEAKFCGHCSKNLSPAQSAPPVSPSCPRCGKSVKAGSKFCRHCRQELT